MSQGSLPSPVGVPLTSVGLWRLKNLKGFFDGELRIILPGERTSVSLILGWGRKQSGMRALRLAKKYRQSVCLLEDGFIRSLQLGGKGEEPLSVVVDDLGIYYDASSASRLEALIRADLDPAQRGRVDALVSCWKKARVSKYNHLPEYRGPLPERFVLVVDQTFGDMSIRYGQAEACCFERMLTAALSENPDAQVILKTHPDVFAGKKQGHFDLAALVGNPRVCVLAEDVHPVRLLEHADAVYVVTSQMGFEGLLWGKRVRSFGMPFYAGWGHTEDDLPAPDRRCLVPLENLVHAALVAYPRYVDPETLQRCEPERVIEWMGFQRQMRQRFPEELYAVGFSDWKKPIIRDYCQGSRVHFVKRLEQIPDGKTVVAWGTKALALLGRFPVICLEDAFLRSVGLGADLVRPLSWVMDTRGLYYDATRPSSLELMLQSYVFDDALLKRASALRERIVTAGLTKYNVGSARWQRPAGVARVILVPGQVESDASIAYGAPQGICSVRRNMDLLRAVRETNPDAYVVYKPHPDVLAGLRTKGLDEEAALQWCDEQLVGVSMHEILEQVDEVHVITSLAGFEALLRGKKVTCYGQPFYSGWGLTNDKVPIGRRTRRRVLDELVAGCLILYPTYVSRVTHRFTTPERALDELLTWRAQGPSTMPWWRKILRLILRLYKH